MQFVTDKNTKVEGQVHVGTTVTVAYQAVEGGENLALAITAQA
jgi:carbonic anhydrase/acetyltransferase-like protein (isoleucine patch superfamily)